MSYLKYVSIGCINWCEIVDYMRFMGVFGINWINVNNVDKIQY